MSDLFPNEEDAIARALRISELQAELSQLTGKPISPYLAENSDEEDSNDFIRDLEAIESGVCMPLYDILQSRRNFSPVPCSRLSHPIDLRENLWLLLYTLASIRVFVDDTDHLSNKELYALLLDEVLTSDTTILPEGSGWNCRFSICEISDKEDPHQSCYLRFYAEEDDRQMIASDYPDMVIPEKEELPYDRDRFLPTL